MHIVVVGAGVVGLTTAWTLIQAGHTVTVVDQASGPAQGASGQNGAQLSYSYVAPLASPQTLRGLPALLLSRSSPLRIDWRQGPALWAWLARFAVACNAAKAQATTQALLALALESRNGLHDFLSHLTPEERAPTAHAMPGKLVLLHSHAKVAAAQRDVELMARHGVAQQVLDRAQCLQLEPALQGCSTGFRAGVFTASDEVIDGKALCDALCARLQQSGHCQILWNAAVSASAEGPAAPGRLTHLVARVDGRRQDLRGDAFVLANGVSVATLAAALGTRIHVQGLRGFSLHVPGDWLARMPAVSVTDTSLHTVFAPLQTAMTPTRQAEAHLRVAGMAELVGPNLTIDPARMQTLRDSIGRVFGWSADADVRQWQVMRPWVGLRPATPDGLPIIERMGAWCNVYLNAGQGALGLTLAFGSARRVVAMINTQALATRTTRHAPRPWASETKGAS
jgi:D-amino-acid dehydrogenase